MGFLAGFVAVLCVGNYYRALRAMERQKHKREARLDEAATGGMMAAAGSPHSHVSSNASSQFSEERQQRFLEHQQRHQPQPQFQQQQPSTRRRNFNATAVDDGTEDLLLDIHDGMPPPPAATSSLTAGAPPPRMARV